MTTSIIKNGYILDPVLPFKKSDILIEDGLIKQISPEIKSRTDTTINASDKIVMPGLISAHSHASTVLFRGLTDNLPGDPWLFYHMWAGMGKLDFRDLYIASAIGAIELLKSGTTSLLEHGHVMGSIDGFDKRVDAIADGLLNTGIRAVFSPMYADIPFSKRIPLNLVGDVGTEIKAMLDPFPPLRAEDIMQALRNLVKRWPERDNRVSLCLGPSAPIGCSPELMAGTFELAAEHDLAIHSHLLETKPNRVFWPSIVDSLAGNNYLGPQVSFAHGVWLDDKDIKILAETKSSVVHNPISNLKLGSGIAHLQLMKERGLNVALGVDNAGGANDSQNMFEVMKYTALLHKLYGPAEKWLGAEDAFNMCLTGGAKVLRKKIGAFKPGYLADMVIIGTNKLFIETKENLINQLVYTDLGCSTVETVLVGGEIVVEGSKIKGVNEDELYAEAKERAKKLQIDIPALHKRLAPTLDLLFKMSRAVSDYELPFTRLASM